MLAPPQFYVKHTSNYGFCEFLSSLSPILIFFLKVSDDEDDMPSSFNRRDHQAGVKLVEQQKKGKQTQALQHEKKVHEITDQLKNSMVCMYDHK